MFDFNTRFTRDCCNSQISQIKLHTCKVCMVGEERPAQRRQKCGKRDNLGKVEERMMYKIYS